MARLVANCSRGISWAAMARQTCRGMPCLVVECRATAAAALECRGLSRALRRVRWHAVTCHDKRIPWHSASIAKARHDMTCQGCGQDMPWVLPWGFPRHSGGVAVVCRRGFRCTAVACRGCRQGMPSTVGSMASAVAPAMDTTIEQAVASCHVHTMASHGILCHTMGCRGNAMVCHGWYHGNATACREKLK